MKTQAMMLAALMLAGCGTVQTVALSDKKASEQLKAKKTYCGAVPRIYSGVTFDFCMLHAERPDDVDAYTYNNAPLGIAIDAVASGALDTLLLPYTIYKQHADGSIEIN
ncbi:YceK/YidQ family lipoprotein [Pseudomonas sp. B2M1-30]|uniref:YceK/YidQ family lipoprotein n=1 Tax=Pseudomonas koreensis TaxID=198620 RepID=A0A9X3BB06_9PSED|nr:MULTISPECIES: YceK/YidQ family lipoprotein [Pseudomonas]MBV4477839.1 YceK/YidQ family lipoprotein [Pseudomonas botevensis]MCU0121810.1 YceK/YidQ family lipoprotein [Pseudomonas sp. B2M1-30]MCU7247955.1 YceK/YidQ family lipoprotein [Pseudomonas koreensis]MCU7264498.1 YceK/YidQ family lipoprotein [Pseudomonas koreensis]